jgi:hypothetical protein
MGSLASGQHCCWRIVHLSAAGVARTYRLHVVVASNRTRMWAKTHLRESGSGRLRRCRGQFAVDTEKFQPRLGCREAASTSPRATRLSLEYCMGVCRCACIDPSFESGISGAPLCARCRYLWRALTTGSPHPRVQCCGCKLGRDGLAS